MHDLLNIPLIFTESEKRKFALCRNKICSKQYAIDITMFNYIHTYIRLFDIYKLASVEYAVFNGIRDWSASNVYVWRELVVTRKNVPYILTL